MSFSGSDFDLRLRGSSVIFGSCDLAVGYYSCFCNDLLTDGYYTRVVILGTGTTIGLSDQCLLSLEYEVLVLFFQ